MYGSVIGYKIARFCKASSISPAPVGSPPYLYHICDQSIHFCIQRYTFRCGNIALRLQSYRDNENIYQRSLYRRSQLDKLQCLHYAHKILSIIFPVKSISFTVQSV